MQAAYHNAPSPPGDFVIVALFALRLAKRIIERLEPYPKRRTDLYWIDRFLAPYHADYALAMLHGNRKADYLATYPMIVTRMKRQDRYPIHFEHVCPVPDLLRPQGRERVDIALRQAPMSDREALALVDFADAAFEWGSTVPLPAYEAQRLTHLAGQRRIAHSLQERPVYSQDDERFDGRYY
ncbi:hypothetical protein IQ07DRAFT_512433 [Pyrenochaeta sp. DS3sAY3a]|nr:hypothetical protein IQ07DRAFT_512433 [Pyrenochaeta sp. DS3sAY3a]